MSPRLRGALGIVSGLVLMACTALASASSAQAATEPAGSIGIRLTDAPSSSPDPHARLYIVNHLAPGDQLTRHIELSNTSAHPVTVSVYASAAGITQDAFTWAEGKTPNELTSWTSLSQETVTIAGHAQQDESVRIRVPSRVSSGERYGVVWAQAASGPAPGGGVELVNRVGVRMYVSIGNGNTGAANFSLAQLAGHRDSKGAPSVSVVVHNTGRRALDLTGALSLSKAAGGLRAGPFNVTSAATIGSGETRTVTMALDRGLPDGPWTAELSLQGGGVTRQISGQVDFIATRPTATAAELGLFIGGAVIVILLVAAVDQLRRRRKRRTPYGTHSVATNPREIRSLHGPPRPRRRRLSLF
jgi:hypothetical protein